MSQNLRLVIDTSSLISYALTRGQIMQQIIEAWMNEEVTLLFSPQTQQELWKVLNRPSIRAKVGLVYDWFVANVDKTTFLVPGELHVTGVCRDPKDEPFLACAVEGDAHYLVTSDKDLLVLRQYEGICILNPGQFLVALTLCQASVTEIRQRYSRETLQIIGGTLCLEPITRQKIDAVLVVT
jgi:putative PIN family toxin of toxin-antitoxin system